MKEAVMLIAIYNASTYQYIWICARNSKLLPLIFDSFADVPADLSLWQYERQEVLYSLRVDRNSL